MGGVRSWLAPALFTCGCATGEIGGIDIDFGAPPFPGNSTEDTGTASTPATGTLTPSSESTGGSDSSGGSDTSASGSSSGEDTSTEARGCGDGVREEDELCDGTDLGDVASCADVDPSFAVGQIRCSATCEFDTTQCFGNPLRVCNAMGTPINDASSTTDFITIPEIEGVTSVTDIDVIIDIQHTWIGDLQIGVSHEGTVRTLYNVSCASEDDIRATFDDSGATLFVCASSDDGLVVRPAQALSGFSGANVSGTWTLQIQDTALEDTGTLREWCVTIAWA